MLLPDKTELHYVGQPRYYKWLRQITIVTEDGTVYTSIQAHNSSNARFEEDAHITDVTKSVVVTYGKRIDDIKILYLDAMGRSVMLQYIQEGKVVIHDEGA